MARKKKKQGDKIILACSSPIWGRPMHTYAFLRHMIGHRREAMAAGIDLRVTIVGSERRRSEILAEGFRYIDVPNSPLGEKYNAGAVACRDEEPDYWTIIGSDVLFLPTIWDEIYTLLSDGKPYIGVEDCFMWRPSDDKGLYFRGYGVPGKPVGSLRCIKSSIMDGLAWRPYEGARERVLDASADRNLPPAYLMSGKAHRVTSVKSESSLSKMDGFRNAERVDTTIFYELLNQF